MIKEASGIKLKPGDRLRCSLWHTRNAGDGSDRVHMIARGVALHVPVATNQAAFSREPFFNLEDTVGRWNQFLLYYIVPKGAQQVSMLVSVKNQERGARFHVDDFSIGK